MILSSNSNSDSKDSFELPIVGVLCYEATKEPVNFSQESSLRVEKEDLGLCRSLKPTNYPSTTAFFQYHVEKQLFTMMESAIQGKSFLNEI